MVNVLDKTLHPTFTARDLGISLDLYLKYDTTLMNWFPHVYQDFARSTEYIIS